MHGIPAAEPDKSAKGRGAILRREPLVLFVFLGSLLYGAWMGLAPRENTSVQIEASALRSLEKAQQELLGRPLTEEERELTRESYIDDEVLLLEALGRGLQWSDYRVRKRLLQVMRGSLVERVPDPSVAQLQAYYRDNIDRYTSSESANIEQVFFPWEEEVSGKKIAGVLEALRSGKDPEPYGVPSMAVPRQMKRASRGTLLQSYGLGPEFADDVKDLPVGEWHGPFESLRGIHLVRIVERHPPEAMKFEELEDYLRQDWIFSREREIQQERIAEIREKYRVEMIED